MLPRREVDVAWRLAPGAPDLQPRKAAVYRPVDGGRSIGSPSGPHPFVPAFTEQPVGLRDNRFALSPHFGRLAAALRDGPPVEPAHLTASGSVEARLGCLIKL